MSCSAASYYSSPNKHGERVLQQTDTLIIKTTLSNIHIESISESEPRIRWVVPKKMADAYQLTIESEKAQTHIIDSVFADKKTPNQVLVQVYAPAGTIISVQNLHGNTFIHHSGKVAATSLTGQITMYEVRDFFWVNSEKGNIAIGLSEVFQQSGMIYSEQGKVKVVTGSLRDKLTIKREEITENQEFQPFAPIETTPDFPYLFIASQSKLTEIVTASSLLW